jgi:hypothetical protein
VRACATNQSLYADTEHACTEADTRAAGLARVVTGLVDGDRLIGMGDIARLVTGDGIDVIDVRLRFGCTHVRGMAEFSSGCIPRYRLRQWHHRRPRCCLQQQRENRGNGGKSFHGRAVVGRECLDSLVRPAATGKVRLDAP